MDEIRANAPTTARLPYDPPQLMTIGSGEAAGAKSYTTTEYTTGGGASFAPS